MFAWDANPLVDSRLYNISDNRALQEIGEGRADRILLRDGRWAIQLRPRPDQLEARREHAIGAGNLVPFGRTYNPAMQPPSLNYEIPHAGDCRSTGLRRHSLRRKRFAHWDREMGDMILREVIVRRIIKVSARKLDFTAAPYHSTQHRGVIHPLVAGSALNTQPGA